MKKFVSLFLALILSTPLSAAISINAAAAPKDLADGGILTAYTDIAPNEILSGAVAAASPAAGPAAVSSSNTYSNLYAAVQGETNANAHYKAFAAKAQEEGYYAIARLFYATADAEMIHANSEWAILISMGATVRPGAQDFTAGTTAQNLQAAIDGETYEYTQMYPGFAATATAEGQTSAASLFKRTGEVENIHANNYQDALNNLNNANYLNSTFASVYLCPVCGAVFDIATLPASGKCSVCGTSAGLFSTFGLVTYNNLYASVQGETNANAKYMAFAKKATEEGYDAIARLFYATANAEMVHADAEWAILVSMGAIVRPAAEAPTVGTTAENLQAAIDGETYEYTTMYPGFAATATAEGQTSAVVSKIGTAELFDRTGRVEHMHADNYTVALNYLKANDMTNLNAAFATVYLCPICGSVFYVDTFNSLVNGNCNICGTPSRRFSVFTPTAKAQATYDNLYAAVQGETNANAHYKAFAAVAYKEGYYAIAKLFYATADAEMLHANAEWAILQSMGATVRPGVQDFTAGTTAQNLQAAIDGETYEYTTMYPGFQAAATAEGQTSAASLFRRTGEVENIHAVNYTDALNNLSDAAYLNKTYAAIYLCPYCGAVFNSATIPSAGKCSVCSTDMSLFSSYSLTTYADLYAAVQGETNASAHYAAFAAVALKEGYSAIANLFFATSEAETAHANAEWATLVTMGATVRPAVQPFDVGTTAQNLQAAIDGETYEYTTMYPGFAADATADGMTKTAALLDRTGKVEKIHADNYTDALNHLKANDIKYLNTTFSSVYLCPVCGAVFDAATKPASNCPVCGTRTSLFNNFYLKSLSLAASVEKLKGNTNNLTVTVTLKAPDGALTVYTATLTIDNNAAGTYHVGPYNIYVDTKGNTQIRDIHVVQ